MKTALRTALIGAMLAVGIAPAASAADIRDLILLKQAGLGEEVLIDVIQTDGSVFHLSAADLIALHNQGFSDKLLRAMLATARRPAQSADGKPAPTTQAVEVPPADFPDLARIALPEPFDRPVQAMEPPPIAPPPGSEPPVTTSDEGVTIRAASPYPRTQSVVEVPVPVVVEVPVYVSRPPRPEPPRAAVEWQRTAPPPTPAPTPVHQPDPVKVEAKTSPTPPPPPPPPPPSDPPKPKGGRGGSHSG